jgi:hypothetical protein
MGMDLGGFQPVSQQNYNPDESAYLINLQNNTGSPITVTGFSVIFTDASGNEITTATSQPSAGPAYIANGESWNFTDDTGGSGGVQVSESTYLTMNCAVLTVDTDSGQLTPKTISEPNGQQNTNTQNISAAQSKLATDVSTLTNDSASLNDDNTLAAAVQTMKNDYGTEQQEYQTEQSDAASGSCGVSGDASAVGGYASAVGGDQSSLNGAINYLKQNGMATVQSDLTAVQGDLSTLRGLNVTPSTDSSGAVAAGNKALADANAAISYATSQGNQIVAEANSLATTAQNYANSHGC